MSKDKTRKPLPQESDVKVFDAGAAPYPYGLLTRSLILDTVINPPDYGDGDRTREDRERHKDRIRDQIRPKLPEIIGGNPIFGDKGKIKVPVSGGYEPRFRYGRDQSGGGGKGKKAGDQEGELIYIELSMEEFIQMLFEEMELPNLLKKQLATTKVKAYKYRGTQPAGPKPRLKKPDTARARIRRAIGIRNANPDQFEDVLDALEADTAKNKKKVRGVPGTKEVPFVKKDYRYHRVEETLDDDSKAVVFFMLDRSGSMGGEPLAIAKAYFLLNLLFLRTKYKDVRVVMIAHDARPYRIEDEKKFYQIEVDGGTMFVNSYEEIFRIAQAEFPTSVWNRYLFQATDGYAFDGDDNIRAAVTKIIKVFNYMGYLEIDPMDSGSFRRAWASAGAALMLLPEEIKKNLGMARVKDLKGLPDAFKQILTKDKRKEA